MMLFFTYYTKFFWGLILSLKKLLLKVFPKKLDAFVVLGGCSGSFFC